jgi:hypothetical protein
MGAEMRRPLAGVQCADRQPAIHRDGIGSLDERFQAVDRHGEPEISRHGGLERQDAVDATLQVEQRPAAVARLNRDGDLQHLEAFKIAPGGEHTLHYAVG